MARPVNTCAGEPTAVYRLYTESLPGELFLLYIGISDDPYRRLADHRRKWWAADICRIDFDWRCCRRHALEEEARAIRAELPAHNVVGHPVNGRRRSCATPGGR
jgi:hypothetical protein